MTDTSPVEWARERVFARFGTWRIGKKQPLAGWAHVGPPVETAGNCARRLRAGIIPVMEGKDKRPGLTPRNLPVAHQRSLHPPSNSLTI